METVPSWYLWSQPLLCLLVCVLSWRARAHLAEGERAPRLFVGLCVLAPAALALWLPQTSYHFAGHEGTYGTALLGRSPAMDDLQSYGTMPLPMGLSWLLGKVSPGPHLQQLWLAGNRLSMGLVLWLMGLLALSLCRRGGVAGNDSLARRASLLVVLLGMASVPMSAWSATGYFVVPALALGACALVLAAREQPSLAVLWAALALGSRMELGVVLVAVLVMVPPDTWKRDLEQSGRLHLALGIPALALELFLLASKKARLPVDSFTVDSSIIWENLLNIPLGGAFFAPLTLLASVVVVALSGLRLKSIRVRGGLAIAFVLALFQPMSLLDVGARHFLPAMLFGLPLLAVALARLLDSGGRSRPASIALSGLLAGLILVPALQAYVDVQHRYVAGQDGYLDRWVSRADVGIRGSIEQVLEPSGCYVVMPGGEEVWRGASEGGDVREVHNSALAQREGQCVRWAFADEIEFSGSASAERVDRAIHTLGLEPVGWLDPPPHGKKPWILFGAGRGDTDL